MTSDRFDFGGLFIFEMANNHQGSAEHGIRIVDAVAEVAREFAVRGAVKLQLRDLVRKTRGIEDPVRPD